MHYTFSDTFFAGVEFSSVYRLGNLFCTVPFRKITFLIDQVGFSFQSTVCFAVLKLAFIMCRLQIPKVEKCSHTIGGVD